MLNHLHKQQSQLHPLYEPTPNLQGLTGVSDLKEGKLLGPEVVEVN